MLPSADHYGSSNGTTDSHPAHFERLTEYGFYSSYGWCLSPALSVRELWLRVQEELDRLEVLKIPWQRQECEINLYLFACAIACTVDDHLAARPLNLAALSGRIPSLGFFIEAAQSLLDQATSLFKVFRDRAVRRWRRRWDCCLNQVCEILVEGSEGQDASHMSLRMTSRELLSAKLPERVLNKRMRLPQGFRCQDLTHQDAISLARLFLESSPVSTQALAIVGLRTAGAYFAPLIKAYLTRLGWRRVSWFSFRPKDGISPWESRQLRKIQRRNVRVLLVDDHPDTGKTFQLALGILRRRGVRPEQVTILVPRHPARPDWTLPAGTEHLDRISVLTLEPSAFHKAHLLEPEPIESQLREYFAAYGWQNVRVFEERHVDEINARLWEHYRDGLHVRLKRVFALKLSANNRQAVTKRIFVKSVGWGWLGYHGYIAGIRLAGFVPPVLGFRNGMLFTEWIDEAVPGLESGNGRMVKTVASYVAARTRELRLGESPWLDKRTYRWSAWDQVLNILRGAYGPYANRL